MGLLDQILGGLAGGAGRAPMGGGSEAGMGGGLGGLGGLGGSGRGRILMALMPIVLGMLANRQRGGMAGGGGPGGGLGGGLGGMAGMGGLGGLLEQFTRRGYGQQANSWISTGPNEALPPEALDDVFGREQLADIASQAGVSEDEARMGLSELLPEMVNDLTPQGRMPAQEELWSSLDDYERRLGGG